MKTTLTLPILVLAVAMLAACDAAPTGLALAPATPEPSRLKGSSLTPDDFDYEIIRVPAALAASGTIVHRANTRGDVVGMYFTTDGLGRDAWRGFLLRKGMVETIHVDGARYTRALGINERGTIVGTYMNEDFTWHGFTYDHGEYTTFDAPAGVHFGEDTWIWDIGANGVMAGSYVAADGRSHGFVLQGGRFTDIMVAGSSLTEGYAINVRGEVAGHFTYADDPDGQMLGFVYANGKTTAVLDYPGENDWMSCAMGIGVDGAAVGHVGGTFPDGIYGWVWKDGGFLGLLMVPGASQTFPTAIAPNGVIAGYAVLTDGEQVGFVARPR